MKIIKFAIIAVTICCVFYFSWLNNPNFSKNALVPFWLNNWSNLHGQLRTGLPFIPLGFIFNTYRKKWKFSISGILLCFAVAVIAEFGQFFIPTRFPDTMDIFYAMLGSFIGSIFHHSISKFETKI